MTTGVSVILAILSDKEQAKCIRNESFICRRRRRTAFTSRSSSVLYGISAVSICRNLHCYRGRYGIANAPKGDRRSTTGARNLSATNLSGAHRAGEMICPGLAWALKRLNRKCCAEVPHLILLRCLWLWQ